MMFRSGARGSKAALTVAVTLGAVFVGCIDRPVKQVTSVTQSGVSEEVRNEGINKVDLLLMVDNSNSMRENQQNIMMQLGNMIQTLTNPPCVSMSNPTPHACVAGDPTDTPQYPPVADMHVGVVSSDLGTPGSSVPGCANSDLGDDGLLNPIRNGQALARHEPWVSAPTTFNRPTDCMDPNQFPSFITFTSGMTDPTAFTHDFQCNAGLYVNGCGLESQLDAVYRALIIHPASDAPGNTSPNAGFLRENALLAIVMLTDEEDGSVRDCRFANGTPCDGTGAIDVYNPASTAWSNMELNMRFYMYQPCGPQDPTWPLERYVDPANPGAGLLSVKPGHPERILFAAIAGVPLAVPTTGAGTNLRIDWDQLLGTPGPNGADDFCGRDSSGLAMLNSAEGPVSMAQANLDPNCSQRVVPSCRREGSTFSPTACTADVQYFAWPSRRIVEIARRFDQSALCNGSPCNNGLVTSVCSNNYASAMSQIIAKIQSRLSGRCLPRVLQTTPDADGNVTVQCLVRETLPEGETMCDASRGRVNPTAMNGMPAEMTVDVNGVQRTVCDVTQVPTNPMDHQPVGGGVGWFYDVNPDPAAPTCTQRISFTAGAEPASGSITRLECIQSVTRAASM
jgi:hypothetical protein